ncbi:C4-dicarboxylate transporter DcuC [Parabacteroides sp. PF5-6]|uniref:C4-dicarboxylate transporter DcuC n=1 Tax=Parabacteroides sp. PF5-6 TaxID=1742403 RepID=UPI002404FA6E|nr:C4-dicarboxylate transporter DcuC [Parabacteroides sp. PF5-6]MDF9831394.1 DcuC family C4-dicarboxylate transporter [Parabacteroides sp. PF5-6]
MIISIFVIIVTAYLLYKKYNPQGVLILAGILMIMVALLTGVHTLELNKPTGSPVFDLFKVVEETFITNIGRAGLMIMTIGGYVAFMNKIEATNALVYVSMKPLSFFSKHPYLAATITIPIGQMLFLTTPSAAGLGLLLVASIYPVLVHLGVSKLTALSVISAATIFDQGPGSANTALAAELIGETNVFYFIKHQLPLVLPTTAVVMLLYYFNNRYFDRKDKERIERANVEQTTTTEPNTPFTVNAPLYFALLPVFPLILLMVFSPYVGLFDPPIQLNTTTAMLFSLFVSLLFVLIHNRSMKQTFEAFGSFWKGMGNVFVSVVTLIVAADMFSKGLISLGFIDSLISTSTHLGFSGALISILMTLIVFGAAVLMGSGNAAFFSFGPLLPNIAKQLGLPVSAMVLPMQLSASMGRAISPIAGVIVAIAGIAGVSPMELAKRNALPLTGSLIFLLAYHFITL